MFSDKILLRSFLQRFTAAMNIHCFSHVPVFACCDVAS